MYKLTMMMLGILLGTGVLYAQSDKADKPAAPEDQLFQVPPFSFHGNFYIALGKGNEVQIELDGRDDLFRLENIDSLLMVFLSDIKPFRDSLSDPMTGKQIDYLIDVDGRKKVRLRQSAPTGSVFVLDGSEPALLRMRQDTIRIIIMTRNPTPKKGKEILYDCISFYLNRYDELESYVTTGLNGKMRQLEKDDNGIWDDKMVQRGIPGITQPERRSVLRSDTTISQNPFAIGAPPGNTQLELGALIGVGNYKSYFTPAVDAGASISKHHGPNVNHYGVYWEPMFLFRTNAQGRLQTYRNDFVVFKYSFEQQDESGKKKDPTPDPRFGFADEFSLGYLVGSRGSLLPEHSFRLTVGEISFKNGLHIAPVLYFNDFFKGVTPGVKIDFGGW